MVLSNYIDQNSPSAVWHSLFSALAFKDMAMDGGKVTATLPALPEFQHSADSGLAPAWLTVALDTLLGMAVFGEIMKAVPIATVDLSTDFIGTLDPQSDALITATCDHIVGNTAFVSGTVIDAATNSLIARASAKFIIKGKPQKGEKKRKSAAKETPSFDLSQTAAWPVFNKMKDQHPYAKWLGAHALEQADNRILHLPFSELIIGDPFARTIHGGILASIMEVASARLISEQMEAPRLLAPLSSSINYLKRTFAGDVYSDARMVRFGRNIIVAHARAWQQTPDEPVASATFLFKGLDAN